MNSSLPLCGEHTGCCNIQYVSNEGGQGIDILLHSSISVLLDKASMEKLGKGISRCMLAGVDTGFRKGGIWVTVKY